MNKKLQVFKYILSDTLAAASAWTLLYLFRKTYIESIKFGQPANIIFDEKYYTGILLVCGFWLLLYFGTGSYNEIFRRSRLYEMGKTLLQSLVGVLVIFFALIIDDTIVSYKTYYQSLLLLLGAHFFLTALGRFILSSITNYRIHNRIFGFNTVLVGSNQNALSLFNEIESQKKSFGNKLIGFVHVDNKNGFSDQLKKRLPHLGEINELSQIIKKHHIEEVIIAIETTEHESIGSIINTLNDGKTIIKVIPTMYDILSGQVKMDSIFDAPLIQISHQIMPTWQFSVKRLFDICLSLFVLVTFSWLYIILSIIVKLTSRGPVFYSHERIGIHGKPFMIHKFRSMYIDAEKAGPALSSKNDPRITPVGRIYRKFRFDEIPQFFNVLIGEMSIVGPRPERQFFIDQIVKRAPHYSHLLKVRPGITSWGQVKYGYAENVNQMIERLKYDIIYIENMSLLIDFKILIYTILTVIRGRGK